LPTSTEKVIGAVKTAASVEVPKGVSFRAEKGILKVKGPQGEIHREYPSDAIAITLKDATVTLTLQIPPQRKVSKALLGTWAAHVKNLVTGANVGFEAKLKSVAAHFPMKLQVKEGSLVIENFLGEKFPRTATIVDGVQATVEGEFVILRGADIERVGRAAAEIERTTHIRDYDPRVFQDGIYIVDRAHPREA
jgi:large subunit ribosomal protein L6